MYLNHITFPFKLNSNTQAVLWVLTGTAVFSLVFTSGRFIGNADLVWQIIFFRYLSGLCLMLMFAKYSKASIKFSPTWRLHFLRALFGGLGGCAAIYAAANMAVADAAAVGLLDRVIAVVLGIFIFSEYVGSKRWLAIFGCLFGALIVLSDKGAFHYSNFLNVTALIALAGAISLALECVFIRMLATKENMVSILLHVNFFGALIFSVPTIYTWHDSDLNLKLLSCLLGPLAIIGQYCNIRGYKIAELSIVAPVGYSWILFAMLIDYYFFNQLFSVTTLFGALCILMSGYFLVKPSNSQ